MPDNHYAKVASLAAELLARAENNPARALTTFDTKVRKNRLLRRAVFLDFLLRVAANVTVEGQSGGDDHDRLASTAGGNQARRETHEEFVSAQAAAGEGRGHGSGEAQSAPAPLRPRNGTVRVSGFTVKPYKRRTHEEKQRAIAAAASSVQSIYERRIGEMKIGDLTWGELNLRVTENAMSAASYLRQGTEATENAILLDKLVRHAVVDDQSRRVRDVVSALELERMTEEAHIEAPLLVERGMRAYAETIRNRAVLEEQSQPVGA